MPKRCFHENIHDARIHQPLERIQIRFCPQKIEFHLHSKGIRRYDNLDQSRFCYVLQMLWRTIYPSLLLGQNAVMKLYASHRCVLHPNLRNRHFHGTQSNLFHKNDAHILTNAMAIAE